MKICPVTGHRHGNIAKNNNRHSPKHILKFFSSSKLRIYTAGSFNSENRMFIIIFLSLILFFKHFGRKIVRKTYSDKKKERRKNIFKKN